MFGLVPWTKRTPAPLAETPFRWMPEEFEKLFNRFLTTWPVMEVPEWPYRYPMTTEETEKEFVVRVELPGFAAEEVKVEVIPGLLKVEAEHKEAEEKGKEKAYASVKRTLTLPSEVELDKVEAVYRNGVLEVHIPRKPEAVARRIEVKT